MNKRKKRLVILGSTGSIGQSTLDVIRRFRDRYGVVGLAAGRNSGLLARQVEEFQPEIVAVESEKQAGELRRNLGRSRVRILCGEAGYEEIASVATADMVVSAITGIAGLKPTLAALRKGKDLALANKESMVVAGDLIRKIAARTGSRIIPVDSEHSGVFQCLRGRDKKFIKKVYLTASGGPFLRVPLEELSTKTLAEALRHPRWKMGQKVTIDSATMMNKGLELVEARWLFNLRPDQLGVLVHPQSIVHALVEFLDGSVLAQLSQTDMRIPIQYALSYPERLESPLPSLDLAEVRSLEFFPVDEQRFPLFGLARKALAAGLSFPVVLNAANEVSVQAFLEEKISFGQIFEIVSYCLNHHQPRALAELDDILAVDRESRGQAQLYLKKMKGNIT
ncbi:MAG: 1-deoxy-D-xylulose-5-phosphate reductoisomerase [Candidatus Aminicenantes bacterium]|uniref:1-deoxy-D-xylulose 5-phosphate reductoisomerase n=1 Tax=Candidatus Saccharicenans subterraneus TaxID=2508984 RepID=A0A3E2BLB5_9BACT|nr:1-deoxy-D-xylulose-5-phosphate reductoisomerase [Candidatus Aminicenantes bacterium]RFT15543.1 MAG: 1-deoxy-D-xylulose 5-phosphate reductoisomerase [Candidatus Saccharicenans subterraneum]